ncbi:MAG: RNA polymerase sigma factor [Phycisphaerae bacterium]
MEESSESSLIRRSQEGDREAFGVLVKKYAGPARGTASLILGNYDEAQDASQEAFVRAWKAIKRFNHSARFFTWYSTILRNVCISRLRKRGRRKTVELNDVHPHLNPDSDPVLLAEQNERKVRVWKAVRTLPLMHREVIVMSHFQGMSYKDMAETLDVPIGTVTSRLHAARKLLKLKLAGEV